jgi:glutamate dehydrogenase
MPDSNADEAREARLAQADEAWPDDPAADPEVLGRGSDNVSCYLRAYYQRIATEDLAPPARMAAVAQAHAQLGLRRPQGRALVQVREPGEEDRVGSSSIVVDIVIDDMPYLVDSVTTELNRHQAEIRLLVHPVLRVRRNVAGTLREFLPGNPGPGGNGGAGSPPMSRGGLGGMVPPGVAELTESWIHVELGPPADRVGHDQLAADLRRVLDDVRVAVEDQRRMGEVARGLADDLDGAPAPDLAGTDLAGTDLAGTDLAGTEVAEFGALLRWLADDNFTFLGYREYDLVPAAGGVGLRQVPGTGLGILRHDRPGRDDVVPLSPQVVARAQDPAERLVLAKANSRSTVYRANYLDYVSVKKLSPAGQVTGEFRFLGLYTHAAHTAPIAGVPVLRRKVAQVLAAAGVWRDRHARQGLDEILQDYPREELFEISASELTPIALGVLRLSERKQTRLFLRRDRYGRYMSCLLYLPRDRYTTKVRLRAQGILNEALHGVSADYSATVGDSALARLYVVVRGERGRPVPQVDAAALERRLAASVRSWDEDLAAEATRVLGEERAGTLLDLCSAGIPETYQADVSTQDAVDDLTTMLDLRESRTEFAVRLVQKPERWTLVVYRSGTPITLSDVLPQLQHMGLEVVDEHPYQFTGPSGHGSFWIYEFGLRVPGFPATAAAGALRPIFEDALTALWYGQTEDDGFNALVLSAGLSWREVNLLRAYAKYLRQGGTRFSEVYLQRVLRSNGAITRLLVRLFESRFDPARQNGVSERCEAITEEIRGQLDEVVSLDHDRILRSYLALIDATLRTNYYQQHGPGSPPEGGPRGPGGYGGAGSPPVSSGGLGGIVPPGNTVPPEYLVLKLDPGSVPGLISPRPKFEIFVYSPRLEAVHLRFGRVARGGLRWSDRLEDFRTEVLGLVKAQEVKNAVIVPSGAKGGFVCKRLPDPGDREAYQSEVLACYQTFIAAMLDVTDNIEGDKVVPPPGVVRRDGDDPYLVVAADKGTATFSDTANEVAARYGFWLGDAFASGGSEGYDHKRMAITARGAWESVKWHFAALGMNPDTDDFTVVGVGDMSGDVFGNGMLLSEHIKLVAAFDHRHVFIDPDPDPAASFAERARMFALPRSSWADYDQALISPGGGIWPRAVKSVPVSAQVRTALGLDAGVIALSVDDLISAILAAPVDLLWNGGIGTYVKASSESHAEVGDRSNDAVRIDATRLRARVVGEGGNLGFTQAARIEYSLGGGLMNTDFIDNSAGVDTSDHEVNIKILFADAIRDGVIPASARHQLLNEMTDEVAALVLRHNYRQNMALAVARSQAPSLLHVHVRYLRKLIRDKRLNTERDVLPGEREIAERRSSGAGLANPELALLLAHTKISAGEDVLGSHLPDDPYLRRLLDAYFPAPLRARFADRMEAHPLRREIITTAAVNEMIDSSGTTFLFRLIEETGASVPDLTRAWLVAREVFDLPVFWRQVEELEGSGVGVAAQIKLLLEGRKLTERAVRWLLQNRRPPFDIQATVAFFADGVRMVRSHLPKLLTGRDLAGFEERLDSYSDLGVPADLAERVAAMVPTYSAFGIVQAAASAGGGIEETAEVYFDLADRLQITRLRDRITALPREDRWSTMARAALRDDLYAAHASLTQDVLGVSGPEVAKNPEERLAAWASRNEAAVAMAAQTLGEIWESERFTFTTLSVALRAIRTLVAASSLPQTA